MDDVQARVRQTSFLLRSRALDQSDDDSSFRYRFFKRHFISFPLHQFVDCIIRREDSEDPLLEFADVDDYRVAGIDRHMAVQVYTRFILKTAQKL